MLQGITKDYAKRVLLLEHPQVLFLGLFFMKGLLRGYRGLQGVTGGYKRLELVTTVKRIQWVTRG